MQIKTPSVIEDSINGLNVVYVNTPFPIASLSILSKYGSENEPEDNEGWTHFLEHMLFKGTKTKSQKDIWNKTQRMGAIYNAWTGKNGMSLEIDVPYYNSAEATELLFDCFFRSNLLEEDIVKERRVIEEEIRIDKADQLKIHREYIFSSIIQDEDFCKSTLGTEESIGEINQDELRAFFKNTISLNNLYFIYIGPEPLVKVMRYLKSVSHYWGYIKDSLILDPHKNFSMNLENSSYNVEVPGLTGSYVSMYFDAPNYLSIDPGYEIARAALLGLENSSLTHLIREELGLTYGLDVQYLGNSNSGNLEIFSQSSDPYKIVEESSKELDRIRKDGIDDNLIECAVSQFKADCLRLTMDPQTIRSVIVSDIVSDADIILEDRLEKVDMINSNIVNENIYEYFNTDKMVHVVYQPKLPKKRKLLKFLDSLK